MNYNKEQIKELLLTDYLDDQLDSSTRKYIDDRLAKDPELRSFLEAAQKTASAPFLNSSIIEPPEHVWQNIKEEIGFSQQREVEPLGAKVLSWVRGLSLLPQRSFAFGGLLTICLIVFVWVGTNRFFVTPVQYSSEQQVEYLMFLAEGPTLGEEEGFETNIENYFL